MNIILTMEYMTNLAKKVLDNHMNENDAYVDGVCYGMEAIHQFMYFAKDEDEIEWTKNWLSKYSTDEKMGCVFFVAIWPYSTVIFKFIIGQEENDNASVGGERYDYKDGIKIFNHIK